MCIACQSLLFDFRGKSQVISWSSRRVRSVGATVEKRARHLYAAPICGLNTGIEVSGLRPLVMFSLLSGSSLLSLDDARILHLPVAREHIIESSTETACHIAASNSLQVSTAFSQTQKQGSMCTMHALFARLARMTGPDEDNSRTPLIRDAGPRGLARYTSGTLSTPPSIASLTNDLESRLKAKLDTVLDGKLREFEQRSLSPLLEAVQRLEERWSRIELALDKCQETDIDTSDAQSTSVSESQHLSPEDVSQMPGSFPGFNTPSPSSSCSSATSSELQDAIEVSTIRCSPREGESTAPKSTKSFTVDTVRKECQSPASPNAWTTVNWSHTRPFGSDLKSSNVGLSPGTGGAILENVVETRGRRLQVLKNELRVKEDSKKLIEVEAAGVALRSLDPRPCHRYYLGKLESTYTFRLGVLIPLLVACSESRL